jgi:peptide/nickel transport system substrate-binding protein
LTSRGERNYGGVNDAELDRLVNELSTAFDAKQRAELLARIQQIVIVERVYEVRPVFLRARVVVGRRWRNYQPSPHLHHITYETRADNYRIQEKEFPTWTREVGPGRKFFFLNSAVSIET